MRPADTTCGNGWSRDRCDVAWLEPHPELTGRLAGWLLSEEVPISLGFAPTEEERSNRHCGIESRMNNNNK